MTVPGLPVVRRGARYVIEAVDSALDHLMARSIACEGDRAKSLELAREFEALRLPTASFFEKGYECVAVDQMIASQVAALTADPHSPRNALVLYIEDVRDTLTPDTWGQVDLLGMSALYSVGDVNTMFATLLDLAKDGDTHATHQAIREYRSMLQLERCFEPGSEGERSALIASYPANEAAGYSVEVIDAFLATVVSEHCSGPLSGEGSYFDTKE